MWKWPTGPIVAKALDPVGEKDFTRSKPMGFLLSGESVM